MFYGLMAGGAVKLSKICRAYRPTITMKKAGDRLCMHLDDERIEKTLHSFIARKVARRVKPDTLIIVDPSDIQKPYATQMDFLSKVWDGSKGAVGDNLGYYGCMAVACENGGRTTGEFSALPCDCAILPPTMPPDDAPLDELLAAFEVAEAWQSRFLPGPFK